MSEAILLPSILIGSHIVKHVKGKRRDKRSVKRCIFTVRSSDSLTHRLSRWTLPLLARKNRRLWRMLVNFRSAQQRTLFTCPGLTYEPAATARPLYWQIYDACSDRSGWICHDRVSNHRFVLSLRTACSENQILLVNERWRSEVIQCAGYSSSTW